MAKYESIVTIRGTIDGLTFRDTAEGPIVGRKTGPTREKVLTHENFKRTCNNASEFKQAVHDARLLRRALGSVLDGVSCTTLNGHVNGLLPGPASQINSMATATGMQQQGILVCWGALTLTLN